MTSHPDNPTLIVVRGLPGSGKTYLVAELLKALGENKVVVLDPDATDYDSQAYLEHTKALAAEGVDPKLYAYRFLRAQAYRAIESHQIIIWNQPFTNLEIFNKMVGRLRNHAAEHDTDLPILIVEVEIDPDVAKERVAQRKQEGGHGPSDETFARRINDYTSFAPHGYATVSVRGDDDVAVSAAKVLQALRDLPRES